MLLLFLIFLLNALVGCWAVGEMDEKKRKARIQASWLLSRERSQDACFYVAYSQNRACKIDFDSFKSGRDARAPGKAALLLSLDVRTFNELGAIQIHLLFDFR